MLVLTQHITTHCTGGSLNYTNHLNMSGCLFVQNVVCIVVSSHCVLCCFQVVANDLFCGQDISDELFLLVCEHKAEPIVVVVGYQ